MRAYMCMALVLCVAACTQDDPAPKCASELGESYLPSAVGAEWTYDFASAIDDISLGEKTLRITDVDGDLITLDRSEQLEPATRRMRLDGERYLWLHNLIFDPKRHEPVSDQFYVPSALRLDATRATLGETWDEGPYEKKVIEIAKCPGWDEALGEANLEACPEDAIAVKEIAEHWKVVAVDELVSDVKARLFPALDGGAVPAGDFTVLCHERTCEPESACHAGTYCFARGVGKVFEYSDQHEELVSYCVPPPAEE